jgi:adenylate cyclase
LRAPRTRRAAPARRTVLLASLCGLAVLLALATVPAAWREAIRERGFDLALATAAPRAPLCPDITVVLVDIDRASLQAVGPWPWSRETLARLVRAVAEREPAAIGLDVLLVGVDERSPAALARRLGEATGRADLAALATTLPDGDRLLAEALALRPAVLGAVPDPLGRDAPRAPPVLVREGARLPALWREAGLSGPDGPLADGAASIALLSLPADADGVVRRAPLLVEASGALAPGLALELLRVASGAATFIVGGTPVEIRWADRRLPLGPEGMLRLLPAAASAVRATVPAHALLGTGPVSAELRNTIVLIGGSAPELGGLRTTAANPLAPSSALQAQAIAQACAAFAPVRPAWGHSAELLAALVAVLLASLAGYRLHPLAAAAAGAVLLAGLAAAAALSAAGGLLLDATGPLAATAVSLGSATLLSFTTTRSRERRLRERFAQHLPPGIVERIAADPDVVRLAGERREITAMFTDIEGFTEATRRAGPELLVATLDGYFAGLVRIVVAHGGMVDKMVGDAVHAYFNAPLDLADHPRRAVACAQEILAWTESYRRSGLGAKLGLGRTRIGIETGEVVIGDVGLGAKLDYTAHGEAVNMAARLEALNKELGTSVCVGPEAGGRCSNVVRPLGRHALRGFGEVDVFGLRDELVGPG